MEEMDGRIQRKVETVARRNCLRSVLAGPSCSKSCSSANATAVSDRTAPAKARQDQEEPLARADFCPGRCGGHRELQESGRRPSDRQTELANSRDSVRARR